MRAAAIAAGVLGAGSALVFALAIAASVLFPNGGTVSSAFNGNFGMGGGGIIVQPIAVPAPGIGMPMPSIAPPDVASPATSAQPSG
jgi:hypothetical protein